MAIHVENLGSSSSSGFPPKLDPTFKAPQLPVLLASWQDPTLETIGPAFRMDYIGSDSLDMGLMVTVNRQYAALEFTPSGQNPPPLGYFQSGILCTPVQLAWYTQMRFNQQSVLDIITGIDTLQPGLGLIATLCCLTGGANSGQCYALAAHTVGSDIPHPLLLSIQKWTFPDVPNISFSEPPHTRLVVDTLLDCGTIQNGDRIFFQAIDLGTSWRLIAYINYNEFRGSIVDSSIGAGQPAFAVTTYAGVSPIITRAYVGGWGPNDYPFPIP